VVGLGLVGGCGGGIVALFLGNDEVGVAEVCCEVSPGGEHWHQAGVGADAIHAGPCLDGCATPGGVNETDWNVLVGVDFAAEEVGNGGEIGSGLRGALGPGGGDVVYGKEGGFLLNAQERTVGRFAWEISCAPFLRTALPGKPLSGISMLDWPEAIHTSPIRRSERVTGEPELPWAVRV